jgi:Protein of unknown function (DUF3461)
LTARTNVDRPDGRLSRPGGEFLPSPPGGPNIATYIAARADFPRTHPGACPMSDKHPNLTTMGITNFEQIKSYSLARTGVNKDILRIKYRRPQGSFRPLVRSYEFERTPRPADPNATLGGDLTIYEVSPVLDGALAELDRIVRTLDSRKSILEDVEEHLTQLEDEFAANIAALRTKLNELQRLD